MNKLKDLLDIIHEIEREIEQEVASFIVTQKVIETNDEWKYTIKFANNEIVEFSQSFKKWAESQDIPRWNCKPIWQYTHETKTADISDYDGIDVVK